MKIQAVPAFNMFKTAAQSNLKASNNIQNNTNDYKLPSYELAFGASKAKINRHSSLNKERKSEIRELVHNITDDMELNQDTEREYSSIESLVKKYGRNQDALKYIFECSDIEDTPEGASFAVAYLSALKENSTPQDRQTGRWKNFLTETLCDTKNRTGKTIPQIFATNASVLKEVFDTADNHPDILYAILTNKDSSGFVLSTHAAHDNDSKAFELLNEKIYYVAARDKSIDLDDAINLLVKNKKALDKPNNELLKTMLSGNYTQRSIDF